MGIPLQENVLSSVLQQIGCAGLQTKFRADGFAAALAGRSRTGAELPKSGKAFILKG